jgi:hypothetical protein
MLELEKGFLNEKRPDLVPEPIEHPIPNLADDPLLAVFARVAKGNYFGKK